MENTEKKNWACNPAYGPTHEGHARREWMRAGMCATCRSLTGGTPLNIFKILKNQTEKKVTGLLRSRVEKIEKISNCVVKLWSNNGQTNYSRILVLLNNYFSFF